MGDVGGNGDSSRSRLRLLLASSSVAALLIGGGAPAYAVPICSITDNGVTTGPVTNSEAINCINIENSTVNGNVTNTGTGTITPTGLFPPLQTGITINNSTINGAVVNNGSINASIGNGIGVFNNATVSGGITNSRTITAGYNGIGVSFVAQFGSSSAGGGIVNSGTISAGYTGIFVGNVSTFAGGITNSGTISAGYSGIFVNGTYLGVPQPISTFSGGISNSGTISAGGTGIVVSSVSTFSGGISNSGTITAGYNGILVGPAFISSFIAVSVDPTFSGGISNSGTISAGGTGIAVLGVSTFSNGITNSGMISAGGNGIFVGAFRTGSGATFSISSFSGGISNSGTISAGGTGIFVSGVSTFSGGITNSGMISASGIGIDVGDLTGVFPGHIGTRTVTVISGVSAFSGGISNSGIISAGATGILVNGVSTFSGGISNTGTISGNIGIKIVDTAGVSIFDSGTITGTGGTAIQFGAGTNTLTLGPGFVINGKVLGSGSDIFQLGGTGTGSFNLSNLGTQYTGFTTFNEVGSATWTVTGTFSQTNPWTIQSGTLIIEGSLGSASGVTLSGGTIVIGNNSALGAGTLSMAAGTTLSFLNTGDFTIANKIVISGDPNFAPPAGTTQTISGVIADGGTPGIVVVNGAGTLVLSATNTYTGPTNVNSGTLDVAGSIASSSLTTIANGTTLIGTGTIGNTQINSGGTFAPGAAGTPGTSMTIAGNLAFQSGAIYLVQVNPTTATFAAVTGAASLSGTVNASFAPGSYVAKQYTILTATGGLGGTTFAGLTNTNLPTGASDSLSYSADDVYLNLTAGFTHYTGLTINQQNVANALTNYFNSTGGIPAAFFGLTPGGLTQVDGEVATGAERSAFQLMNEFLLLMLDPFVDGRGGTVWPVSGGVVVVKANGFAPEQDASLPPDIALAYASVLKVPPPAPFAQRWTAWGASFGGSSTTNGDPVVVGSSNVTARTFGFAGGMDYHYSPDTIFGFALAGGGTNWGLSGGLGDGRSDAFQAGVYGITRAGPAYLAAALAFTNNWMTTNRSALGDQLTANFDAQSYGARVEAGYRYAVLPTLGVTPYAALQAQDFHTPSYSETDVTGGGFGLSYNAMSATDTRSELGARFDDPTVVGGMPLILRARVAWAHDWVSNPSLGAVFESLPGTGFVVNGAPMPQNSALTSAGAELFLTSHLTLLAKFDGEFANGSQTYAGSGTLRYSW